jgi:ADP-heptose:LPS heptosyltransferase
LIVTAPADTNTANELAVDCRYFLGDRPCVWHKREGVTCRCDHYEAIGDRVLIVKLDAMGDVLRTTSLLPVIAAQHRAPRITWLTRPESLPLLENNPLIGQVMALGPDATLALLTREFDRVINMDAGQTSAGLASLARAGRKDGYVLHPKGFVQSTNPSAEAWLRLGVDDSLKRRGTRTYQAWMTDILEATEPTSGYVFELRPDELTAGRAHLDRLGVRADRPLIGLNTGAGGRWPLKQWRLEGFIELIDAISRATGAQFLLLGGPSEESRNEAISRATSGHAVLDPGCHNPVRHFAALVAGCDVVVTGDTLAMHLALALKRRTVVIFGPTSAPEIELYGLGEKVIPDMTCLSCYKNACDFVPNCMDLVSTDMVASAVTRQLAACERRWQA